VSAEAIERKLAAVLAADIAGFSRLAGADEEGVLARLRALRAEVIDPEVAAHGGRVFKRTGDGFLAEFRSVVAATRCALEIQSAVEQRNTGLAADRRLEFRIGIHLGDMVAEPDGDLMGDGVNLAARIEGVAAAGGIALSQAAYEQVRDRLELAVSDRGEVRLKNIARPVRVFDVAGPGAAPARASEAPATLALPDKPSIAVLPFQNMSGDPEQEYFADGMVEDIITALSRVPSLFVIARNSSFTYKGKAIDVKHVGRELGVRYVLEGSVRRAGNRLRITGQLIDAASGAHLWADKFDGALEDVFELQDRVALAVAGAIEPALVEEEMKRARRRATADLTAYDLALRARAYNLTWNREGALEGLALARRAIALDPQFGLPLAIAAWCQAMLYAGGWAEDPEAAKREGAEFAWRAVRAAANDAYVLAVAAGSLDLFDEASQTCLALVDQALALSPSNARAWFWSGFLRLFAGQADTALEHFEKALRLDPRTAARPYHQAGIGACYFFQRRFEEAVAELESVRRQVPTYITAALVLASCYTHMGRPAEARATIARLRATSPEERLRIRMFRDPAYLEFYLAGLEPALAAGDAEESA
jgi:TolB-like protein/class 3 adenylate cyclase/Flp pilus assembly protein TadD